MRKALKQLRKLVFDRQKTDDYTQTYTREVERKRNNLMHYSNSKQK